LIRQVRYLIQKKILNFRQDIPKSFYVKADGARGVERSEIARRSGAPPPAAWECPIRRDLKGLGIDGKNFIFDQLYYYPRPSDQDQNVPPRSELYPQNLHQKIY